TMREVADGVAAALRGVADTAVLFGKLIDALGSVRSMLVEIERVGAKLHFASWTGIGERVRAALPEWLYTPIGSGKVAGATPSVSAPVAEFDPTLGAPLTPAERAAAESARLKALRDALGGGGGNKPGGGGRKSEAELEAERVQRAYESLMATMRERIALFDAEGEAAKVAYALEHGALKALDDAKKQELLTEAQRYDALVKR